MNRDRALDQVKAETFVGQNAAFLGCLLCNLKFSWDSRIETACVSETDFLWNPDWFDSLDRKERVFVLLHELWHIALLHGLREGNREHDRWNAACDYKINAMLRNQGYQAPKGTLYKERYNDDKLTEEEIYETIPLTPQQQYPKQAWGSEKLPKTEEQVAMVQTALATAQMAGDTPGNVQEVLSKFLKPKLPWKQLLHKYLLDRMESEWSWNRPNKRFSDVYLPAFLPQDGRLTKIAMFLDTSGSIEEEDIKRFVSEVKFVQEVLNPEKLLVVQFDTKIQEETVYNESHAFRNIKVKGFGGTDYQCVHQYILKHKPTLSVIFTDLYACPMKPVGKLDTLWIVKNNSYNAPFGKTIHVD